MSSPLNLILRDSYTSAGTARTISLPGPVDYVIVRDISNLNAPVNNEYVGSEFFSGMNSGTALVRSYTGAQPATSVAQTAANGFILSSNADQNALGASVATTATTAANPAVVSTATTTGLLANSSIVRIYNTVNMRQISPVDFSVGAVNAGVNFQLRWLDASGFAAAGVAGSYRIVTNPPNFSPRQYFITNVSQAASARITLSVTHDIQIGEEIRFNLPEEFGMSELNGLSGTVTATGNADASGFTNTIDVDINSTAFTAFSWPASATVPITHPQAIRFGVDSQPVIAQASTNNNAAWNLVLGTSVVGPANDLMEVLIFSGTQI